MNFKDYHLLKVALGVFSFLTVLIILFPNILSNQLDLKSYDLQLGATLVLAFFFLFELVLHSIEIVQNKKILKDHLYVTFGKQKLYRKLLNILWALFIAYLMITSIDNKYAAAVIASLMILKIPQNLIWVSADWKLAISQDAVIVHENTFQVFKYSDLKNLLLDEDKMHVTLFTKRGTFKFKFRKREVEPYVEVFNSISAHLDTQAEEKNEIKSIRMA